VRAKELEETRRLDRDEDKRIASNRINPAGSERVIVVSCFVLGGGSEEGREGDVLADAI
jgi:hypothetical protein